VNTHGALVVTTIPLELREDVTIHVQLTGKSADATVLFASKERPSGSRFEKLEKGAFP